MPPGRGRRRCRACARTRWSSRPAAAQRGAGAGEPVGGLVERAVAAEHDDDLDAVERGAAGEAGGVAAPRRLRDLELVVCAEHPLHEHPPPRGHRRRGRVDDQRTQRCTAASQAHGSARARSAKPPYRCAPYWHAYDPERGQSCARPAALTALTDEIVGVPGVPATGRVARAASRTRSGPRSATRATGAARCRASAIRRPGCSSSGSRPPPTAATAPGGCSPATARATGCSARCTAPGTRTSRRPSAPTTGWSSADAYVAAAVRCAPPANKPTPEERDRCLPYLVRELGPARPGAGDRRARRVRVRRHRTGAGRRADRPCPRPRPPLRARRGGLRPSGRSVLGCYHPSQQNTFTGKLTEPMLDDVFARARCALRDLDDEREDLADSVDERDGAEHDRDREPQAAVAGADGQVRAEPRAGDHPDRTTGARTPSRCCRARRA